jgi:hypothetical protein
MTGFYNELKTSFQLPKSLIMKKIRRFILLLIITFCSSMVFGQYSISGPTTINQGSGATYTSDPFYSFDLPPDFTNYTFDWWASGTIYTDWYTTSETCGYSGASAYFHFITPSPSSWPYVRRVILTFEPWWGTYESWLDVDVI